PPSTAQFPAGAGRLLIVVAARPLGGAGGAACQAGQSSASPPGRKILARGVSRVEPVVSPRSPGTGRKTLSLDGNVETPATDLLFCSAKRPAVQNLRIPA